jgi:hypothetical protein
MHVLNDDLYSKTPKIRWGEREGEHKGNNTCLIFGCKIEAHKITMRNRCSTQKVFYFLLVYG